MGSIDAEVLLHPIFEKTLDNAKKTLNVEALDVEEKKDSSFIFVVVGNEFCESFSTNGKKSLDVVV